MKSVADGDRLIKHGTFLLLMSQMANICNMAFHMVMGRRLSPDEYGILATLLNMMLVLATPLDALRNAMAHTAGRSVQEGDLPAVRALAVRWLVRTVGVGLMAGCGMMIASGRIAEFFHLASPLAVQVAGGLMPVMLVVPVLCGILQGAQSFVWMSFTMHGWSVLRLAVGSGLVIWWAATATSGVIAHAISQVVSFGAGCAGVVMCTRGVRARAGSDSRAGAYFLQALFMLAGYAVLMNSDVMLVRHYQPGEAGHFAWAATIGRSVIFLPMPIALAMFPKVITMGSTSSETRRTLGRAMMMTAVLIGGAVGSVWLMPWLPLRIIYNVKSPDIELMSLVRWVCLAMSPLGFTYVLLHFEMAQRRFACMPWLLVCAGFYVGGVALWHETVLRVVSVLGLISLASALLFAAHTMSVKEE